MIDWGVILQAIILALIGAIVPSVIKWMQAHAALQLAKAKDYAPEAVDWLTVCAEFAVKAAEQSGLAGLVDDKKKYALEIAERWLIAKGINLDLHLVDAAIERAVIELFPHEAEPTS